MRIDRRGFFHQSMIAAAALAVDPERLFWIPGTKKIFIPTPTKRVVVGFVSINDVRRALNYPPLPKMAGWITLLSEPTPIDDPAFWTGSWPFVRLRD